MAELAYAIALGAIGATLGGSNPLPPMNFANAKFTPSGTIISDIGLSKEKGIRELRSAREK